MKHLFIINPISFRSRKMMDQFIAEIDAYFRITGNWDYLIHISQFPRDAIGAIRAFANTARQERAVRIYAVGGDGILYDCLNGAMGFENVELAAIPYGNTNSFVRGFGGQNMALFRDISRQVTAPAIPVDVIHTYSIYALGFCAFGVTPLAIRNTQKIFTALNFGKGLTRWLGRSLYEKIYLAGTIPAFFDQKTLRQHYHVEIDGEDLSGSYRGILLANGAYYAGSKSPARNARPNDGFLDVILARSGSSLRSLSQLPYYLRGRYDKFPDEYILRRARKISISSKEEIPAVFDEVIFYDKQWTVELLPAAAKFVDVTGQGFREAVNDRKY